MKAKRKRLTEKEWQRRERQRAEEQTKSRSESESRQQRIKVLRQELPNLAKKTDKELAETELVRSLVELVHKQDLEINYMRPDHELCKWAETHAPDDLGALREKHAGKDPFVRVLRAVVRRATELTPKQAYERQTRSRRPCDEVGLIEYEFGGRAQARAFRRYDPSCLDGILMGYGMTMESLEILFGMERHRFPKGLSGERETDVKFGILLSMWSRSWTPCWGKNYENENPKREGDLRESCGPVNPILESACSWGSQTGHAPIQGTKRS
jgi:hypothetical protein